MRPLYRQCTKKGLGTINKEKTREIERFARIEILVRQYYHNQNHFYGMSRPELQITVSLQLSAAILLLLISAVTRFFSEKLLGTGGNNCLKVKKKPKKHSDLLFKNNMLRNGLPPFKFLNFPESQTLRSFLQAADFILAENIKLIDSDKNSIGQVK